MHLLKSISIISALQLISISISAQETAVEKKGYKYNNNFDLALAGGSNQYSQALSWVKFHSFTKKKRFKFGYGIRFTAQEGKNLYYTTAPAILTSKQTGPQVLFSEIFYENVDSLFISKSQNNSLNLSINLQYTIKEKFDIGFNIDAVGFSFGNKVIGKYYEYNSAGVSEFQTAKPTSYNALLVSDNDIGALNSEFYFRYWLKPKWAVRAGASFLFTEYTTENELRLENNRWRNKSFMGMVGITFSPFR